MKIQDILRTRPNGNPVAEGTDVQIRKVIDNVLVDTVQTDADGMFTYEVDESPGPLKYTFTYGGETRIHSTQSVMPVDGFDLSALRYILQFFKPGVIQSFPGTSGTDRLRVSANGTNMNLTVNTGVAIAYGMVHVQSSPLTLTVSPNSSGSTRTDAVFVRMYYQEDRRGETEIFLSSLGNIQTDPNQSAGYMDVELARVTVDNGVTAIATNKVADTRTASTPQIKTAGISSTMLDSSISLYPTTYEVELEGSGLTFAGQAITTTALTTLINTPVVLPTGSWSGLIYFDLSVFKSSSTNSFTLTSTFGATTESRAWGVAGLFTPSFTPRGVIEVTNATGTVTATLQGTFSNAAPDNIVIGPRIHGTLVRTGA